MKPEIAPTSPKRQTTSPVEDVWKTGVIQKPTRIPWGRIIFLILSFSLVFGLGILGGAVWLQRYGPVGWWSKWLPVVDTTTVIQQTATRTTSEAPKVVQDLADSLTGLAVDKGGVGVYGQEDLLTMAVPLSDNGWSLTLQRPPSPETTLVALRPNRDIETVTAWVADPSTPFVFAKAGPSSDSPATLGDISKSLGQSVWVVSGSLGEPQITSRRLIGSTVPAWPSSDRLERTYQLDAALPNPSGSLVINQSGQLLGLVANDGQVWSVQALQPILKDLIQTGTFERTGLGLRSRRREELVILNQPTANGWLVGAGADQTAVETRSPADRAGIKSGDIIVAIDGQAVQQDAFEILQRWRPGETTKATIERGGSQRELTIEFSALRP